jgi:hypothetical protein
MPPPLKSISFRIPADLHHRLRHFLREQAAAPWYLRPSTLAESALRRELDRLDACLRTGDNPGLADPVPEDEDPPVHRRTINHTYRPR